MLNKEDFITFSQEIENYLEERDPMLTLIKTICSGVKNVQVDFDKRIISKYIEMLFTGVAIENLEFSIDAFWKFIECNDFNQFSVENLNGETTKLKNWEQFYDLIIIKNL